MCNLKNSNHSRYNWDPPHSDVLLERTLVSGSFSSRETHYRVEERKLEAALEEAAESLNIPWAIMEKILGSVDFFSIGWGVQQEVQFKIQLC